MPQGIASRLLTGDVLVSLRNKTRRPASVNNSAKELFVAAENKRSFNWYWLGVLFAVAAIFASLAGLILALDNVTGAHYDDQDRYLPGLSAELVVT